MEQFYLTYVRRVNAKVLEQGFYQVGLMDEEPGFKIEEVNEFSAIWKKAELCT